MFRKKASQDIRLSAPTNFSLNGLRKLSKYCFETYGNMYEDIPSQSCSVLYSLPENSKKAFLKYVHCSHDLGITFNYIINDPRLRLTKELCEYLDWLDAAQIDGITVCSVEVLKYVKKRYSWELSSSVFSKIDTLEKARIHQDYGCDVICIAPGRNQDLDLISRIKQGTGLKVKILVNNMCIIDCQFSKEHHLDVEKVVDLSALSCIRYKFSQKLSMRQYSFVFPERIPEYISAGVDVFKIGGRRNSSKWVYDCARAYSEREYRGNYYHIMNSFGSSVREKIFFRRIFLLFPEAWIRGLLKAGYFFTKKRSFGALLRQRHIKALLKISTIEPFFIDRHGLKINKRARHRLEDLLERIGL